jgi:hypothetical protein
MQCDNALRLLSRRSRRHEAVAITRFSSQLYTML